jgi:hypothetical protein
MNEGNGTQGGSPRDKVKEEEDACQGGVEEHEWLVE